MGGIVLVLIIAAISMAIGQVKAPAPTSGIIESPVAVPLPVVGPTSSALPTASPPGPSVAAQGASEATPTPAAKPSQVIRLIPGPGLDDTTTTAAGYAFEDQGIERRAFAALLARKFGVDGIPRLDASGSWAVSGESPGMPRVEVLPGPMVTWEFTASPTAAALPTPASVTGVADRATALARAFLADLGVPVEQLDWQVEVTGGGTVVTGWQVIAGQRTTVGWRIALTPDGQMTQASGFAASPVTFDDYAVLGARSAVVRSGQPQWAALGPTPLSPAKAPAESSTAAAPAVRTVVVTSADLGLAQFTQRDGGLLILPAYVLTGDDGSTWSLVAVSGAYVRDVRPMPAPSAATTREAASPVP